MSSENKKLHCHHDTNKKADNMTPSGQASKATKARKLIRQKAEITMQRPGTRAEREKRK
jgi:hypothetical protein